MSELTPDPMFTLTIVETINYQGDVPLSELEELAGITLAECEGDLDRFVVEVRAGAENKGGWCESFEAKNGDVQGQEWTLERGAE